MGDGTLMTPRTFTPFTPPPWKGSDYLMPRAVLESVTDVSGVLRRSPGVWCLWSLGCRRRFGSGTRDGRVSRDSGRTQRGKTFYEKRGGCRSRRRGNSLWSMNTRRVDPSPTFTRRVPTGGGLRLGLREVSVQRPVKLRVLPSGPHGHCT